MRFVCSLMRVSIFLLALNVLVVHFVQAEEKIPEALGTYLSSDGGLLPLRDEGGGSFPLRTWNPDRLGSWDTVRNTSGSNVCIISYSAFGAMRDPEKFRLYRLAVEIKTVPYILPPAEIELSLVPIIGISGLLGNMVKLVPGDNLIKGNYLLTYPGIEKGVEQSWRFTIDKGYQSVLLFGVYLAKPSGLVRCNNMTLKHTVIMKSKKAERAILLEGWAAPPVQDMGAQGSIYIYFRDRNFQFYKLASQLYTKPRVSPSCEIEMSVESTGNSGVLGSVMRLAPKIPLVKGNYLLTNGSIDTADNCWGFTVDGGSPLWMGLAMAGCLSCLSGVLGVLIVIALLALLGS